MTLEQAKSDIIGFENSVIEIVVNLNAREKVDRVIGMYLDYFEKYVGLTDIRKTMPKAETFREKIEFVMALLELEHRRRIEVIYNLPYDFETSYTWSPLMDLIVKYKVDFFLDEILYENGLEVIEKTEDGYVVRDVNSEEENNNFLN